MICKWLALKCKPRERKEKKNIGICDKREVLSLLKQYIKLATAGAI